jgi:hypothetical protein
MQTLIERGCGLNVHQATVVACLLMVRRDGKVQKQFIDGITTKTAGIGAGGLKGMKLIMPSTNSTERNREHTGSIATNIPIVMIAASSIPSAVIANRKALCARGDSAHTD